MSQYRSNEAADRGQRSAPLPYAVAGANGRGLSDRRRFAVVGHELAYEAVLRVLDPETRAALARSTDIKARSSRPS